MAVWCVLSFLFLTAATPQLLFFESVKLKTALAHLLAVKIRYNTDKTCMPAEVFFFLFLFYFFFFAIMLLRLDSPEQSCSHGATSINVPFKADAARQLSSEG